ncbi:MAG TPA: hypothetical protein VEG38_19800, partial [Acidimicrobiia bacterium]|nr:hypothetical protein [Acidimicrobiia bacterium]
AGRYRFSHALVRATLYDSLTASRKVRLHRRLAEAIESVHGDGLDHHLPALARHWARASPPPADTANAVEYATRAGDRALAQLAHDEAATYYRQALEFLRPDAGDLRQAELLIAVGEAQRRAGDPAHRETLLDAGRLARHLGDVESCARAALANHSGLFSRYFDVDAERVAALEDALEAVGPSETPVRARLLAALAGELYFVHDERRRALGGEALAVARRLGDPATLAEVLASVWYATSDPTTREERTALVTELSDLARELRDHLLGFHAGLALFLTAMQEGDLERADAELENCARLADELRQPVLRWRLLYSRATREMAAGRFEAAECLVEEARRVGEAIGQPDTAYCYDVGIASIRLLEHRLEEALAICERRRSVLPFLGAAAWCHAAIGDAEEAGAIVRSLRSDHFAQVPRDHGWLVTLTFLARASACLGDTEATSGLYELLLPCRDEVVAFHMGWAGPVASDLGLLAASLRRYDEADARFSDAAETLERMASPARLAQVRLEWARTLLTRRQRGDVERAQELVRGALAVTRELGLDAVKARSDAVMN